MAFGGGIDDRPVLDQSHDAKHNRREDRSEHPVGNQSETGNGVLTAILTPIVLRIMGLI